MDDLVKYQDAMLPRSQTTTVNYTHQISIFVINHYYRNKQRTNEATQKRFTMSATNSIVILIIFIYYNKCKITKQNKHIYSLYELNNFTTKPNMPSAVKYNSSHNDTNDKLLYNEIRKLYRRKQTFQTTPNTAHCTVKRIA